MVMYLGMDLFMIKRRRWRFFGLWKGIVVRSVEIPHSRFSAFSISFIWEIS